MSALALAIVATMAPPAAAAELCPRADFEAVVDGAGDTLRTLTQTNSPAFQAKLRALKDKRGWTHEQFLAEGARFVKDDKIAAFDDQAGTLLARINSGSDGGTGTATDCTLLAAMKADMATLVAIQSDKWTYMFATVDAELAK